MTTVLELAAHADLPVETVLRVLLREPTNENTTRKVAEAVATLGLPDYPRPDGQVEIALPDDQLGELATAADPRELVGELRQVFQDVLARLDRERRERIDDVALTTDLITEGWRTVDRRLGRLEKIVERLERAESAERETRAEVRRLDDLHR